MAMGVFEVHAGSFEIGKAHQMLRGHLVMKASGHFFREKIPLSEIVELEVASQESVNKLGGAIGWGIAGDVLLGPVGLLAGLLRGGRGNRVTFVCKLKDGRKFLATAPSGVFSQMRIGFATSEFGRPPKAAAHQDVTQSEIIAPPNIDRQKWDALLLYDKDIASAAERIRSLGAKWVDELASAYLALNDKHYLPIIVDGIVERARIEQEGKNEQKSPTLAQTATNSVANEGAKCFCPSCGKWIHQAAPMCPYCGATARGTGKHKTAAIAGRDILTAIAWGYAIVAGLGGIAGVFEGNYLTGILLVASAIIVFPPSSRLVERHLNVSVPGWLRVVGGVALFFAASATIPDEHAVASAQAPAPVESPKQAAIPSAPITASGHIPTNITNAFSACLLSRAKDDSYSSFDGGKSAIRLIGECDDQWKAYSNACMQSGRSDVNCTQTSAILAQAALKLLNK